MRKDRLVFEICRRAVRTCFLPRRVVSDTWGWLLELSSPDMVEEGNEFNLRDWFLLSKIRGFKWCGTC